MRVRVFSKEKLQKGKKEGGKSRKIRVQPLAYQVKMGA
jgi:hypothetical protein